MKPFYLQLSSGLHLEIIPNIKVHLDGHTVITRTYSIYRADNDNAILDDSRHAADASSAKENDPDYCGYITFEKPGKLFTYTADGTFELDTEDISETIEQLSYIRDNPALWDESLD